jgi:hypothetical protein
MTKKNPEKKKPEKKKHALSTREKLELMVEEGFIYLERPVVMHNGVEDTSTPSVGTVHVRARCAKALRNLGVKVIDLPNHPNPMVQASSFCDAVGSTQAGMDLLEKALLVSREVEWTFTAKAATKDGVERSARSTPNAR